MNITKKDRQDTAVLKIAMSHFAICLFIHRVLLAILIGRNHRSAPI